jgi:hypothetical protein
VRIGKKISPQRAQRTQRRKDKEERKRHLALHGGGVRKPTAFR